MDVEFVLPLLILTSGWIRRFLGCLGSSNQVFFSFSSLNLAVVVENITKLFLSALVSDKVLDWILIRVFISLDMISQLS